MKLIVNGGGGGGGRLKIPTEDEVEVAEILLSLPKLVAKSELIKRYRFNWGLKKKRSVLVSPSPSTQRRIVESVPEKVTEEDGSPSTPLCFVPSGSGSDGGGGGGDKCKPPSPSVVKKNLKRKATDDLIESYNKKQQEREILLRETKAMKTLHQELTSANLGLKAIIQKVNYSRNIEDFQQWTNPMKTVNQQSYHHPQITMFAPPPTPQLVVDPNNGKLVAVHGGGGRFGLFNQIDPRVKIHGQEAYDFMASSQPLDQQSKYLMMDNDLRARNAAAAARKRRILRMKENKNAMLALKLSSRGCRDR